MAFHKCIEQSDFKIMRQLEVSEVVSVWMPPNSSEVSVLNAREKAVNVRKVESIQTKPVDVITRLRNTLPGRIYITYLRQYAVVRWVAYWLWCNGYPLYINHLATRLTNGKAKRWRPLTKLSDFAQSKKIQTHKLAASTIIEMSTPIVFPVSDQECLVSAHDRYKFPDIFVVTVNKAITYGGTNLILADDKVICHDLYDFERDYTSEELHGRTLIDHKSCRIRWLLHDEAPEPIPMAATFVDACALNYAHWLTEVLPRIAIFCADPRFNGIPLVVNHGLHKNIMQSLFLVAGAEHEIITIPVGRALAVDLLYLTSVAGYVPFEQRTAKLDGHSHGMFSPWAFKLLINNINVLGYKNEEITWPTKIFLRRNSSVRRIINEVELENALAARGYVIVDPGKLTFLQQVELFKNANRIISPTGAALANAIFCRPGTQVAVLMAKHKNMIYWYWSNMLTPMGINVGYVLCNIVENPGLGIHGDYEVNIADVIDLLEAMEGI